MKSKKINQTKVDSTAARVRSVLSTRANPKRATVLQRFFKTSVGQYGHGDEFLGITVPECRVIAKQFRDLPLRETEKLLHSKIHEERLAALLILVDQFERGTPNKQNTIVSRYLQNTQWVNNWDLVDLSAPKILGRFLFERSGETKILERLARSRSLWKRRIAIVATLYFIQHDRFAPTLRIARLLLKDSHDLIHKAAGWMLREVGKRSLPTLERFLKSHRTAMPRTMLRYALERLPPKKRNLYLMR